MDIELSEGNKGTVYYVYWQTGAVTPADAPEGTFDLSDAYTIAGRLTVFEDKSLEPYSKVALCSINRTLFENNADFASLKSIIRQKFKSSEDLHLKFQVVENVEMFDLLEKL